MMNIKKLFAGLTAAAAVSTVLCSCGGGGGLFADPTPTPIPSADAAAVVTMQNVNDAVGGQYTIELEGGAAVKEDNVSTASYRAVPNGAGDPVIVKVIGYSSTVTQDQVWNDYEAARISRPAAKLVEGIGDDAYIAYPSIHVYTRGCEIVITAGSGSDDGQDNVLKKLAQNAVDNISTIMP